MSTETSIPVNDVKSNLERKAYDLMLRGRSLNSGESFNQEAFDLLTKAIKLNPHLIEAWIDLTKCYQRKSDIDGAIACLENALKYCDSDKPNKVILRKLSTCIRQKDCDTQEAKISALLKSLDLSKQALKSDLYDEENYYNLAKAYMCLFFVTECVDQQLINLSRAAYMKAFTLSNNRFAKKVESDKDTSLEQDVLNLNNPESKIDLEDPVKPFIEQSDFLFNYSTVLVYLQEFQKALEYLRLAIDLDPEWMEPKILEECLVDYLKQIHSMISELSKNQKKVIRRYSKVVDSLKSVDKIEAIIHLDQQRLQRSLDLNMRSLSLDELEISESSKVNESKDIEKPNVAENIVRILHLKLINTINYNQAMYLTFIAIDQNYSLTVVTIYNLAASRCPSPKDIVTLIDPKIEQITVDNLHKSEKDSSISFNRINVREFKSLYVNGFRITTDQVSKPQFRVSVLP